ncbi:MFS transporter [Archaeoglobus neptunius]|uniref:MFS transporter n=1 Tax=Archaeoglobus neptunius TaxID=2798580 RepID=UPI001927E4A6|nr:MFS transporter [Archaeoglobus neptunius]
MLEPDSKTEFRFSRTEKLVVLVAAAIGWSHDAVGLTLLNFLAEPIMKEFNVGTLEVGFIFSAQYIFCIFGAMLFGELGDRFGRKNALILSILWVVIFSVLSAFAPNFWTLAVLRIISGMGVTWGLAFTYMSEFYSPKRRGLFGGLIHATFIFGFILSALSVSLIYPVYGWRACFFVTLYPIPFLVLFAKYLPESRIWEKHSSEAEKSLKLKEIISNKTYLKMLILATILFWLAEFAYHAIVDWSPTFIIRQFGYAPEEASAIVLRISLVALIVLPFVGFISDYVGRRSSFAASALIGLIGCAMLAYFTLINYNPQLALLSLFVIPIGFGSHALFGVWSSEMFPTRMRATATSVIFSIARGLSVGGLVVGYVATFSSLLYGMLLGSIAFFFMIFLPWLLPETKGKELEEF